MLEQESIRRVLPQRYPFLFVDRVQEIRERSVVATKAVTIGEYCYRNPLQGCGREDFAYPLSVIIEAFSQAAGMLLIDTWPKMASKEWVAMFGSFAAIQVLGHAYPGDCLELRPHLDTVHEDAAVISGEVVCDGRTLVKVGRIAAILRPATLLKEGRSSRK
jgi:3-hydroxyacyl-[acyl-carrier-protein] dehydratase